jgi:hypothetical protein
VTHTGLDVGATIFLEYSIISEPKFIKELIGTEIMQEAVPVESYELVLTVPARRALKYELLNSDQKAEELIKEKYRSYKWSFMNLSQKAYEQAAPASYQTAPVLNFSSYTDDVSTLKAMANQQAYMEKDLPISLTNAIKKIKVDTNNEQVQILEIQKLIVNSINTKNIPADWHNYLLETPRRVWDANVGSTLEKTILLAKAFQNAGYGATVVGLYPNSLYQNAPLIPSYFEDFGVLMNSKSAGKFADIYSAHQMNNQSLEYSHPASVVLDLSNGQLVELFSQQEKNLIDVYVQLNMDIGQQISGDVKLKLDGACVGQSFVSNPMYLAKKLTPGFPLKDGENFVFSQKQGAGENIATLSYPTFSDGLAMQQENYYFWKLPQMQNGIAAQHFNLLPTLRDFPLVVDAIEESYEYVLTTPKSVEWVGKEYHKSYNESFGKMSLDVFLKDGNLVVKKSIIILPSKAKLKAPKSPMNVDSKEVDIQQRTLTVEEYAIFRQMMIDWNSDLVNMLVFKR